MSAENQGRATVWVKQRLTQGLQQGIDVDLASAPNEPTPVQANDLREAFLATRDSGDPRPVTISGCSVTGSLDLRNVTVGVPVTFANCTFDAPIRLEGASMEALGFVDCPLVPGIVANGCTIHHDLLIDRTTIKGELHSLASMRMTAAVWLCEAKLGGRLLVRNQAVIDGGGGRSIQADRISIGANIRILNGSEIRGEFRAISARVAGSLDIVSSSMIASEVIALELAESTFGGSVFLARMAADTQPTVIDGLLSMSDVSVGAFVTIRGSVLKGRAVRAGGSYDRPKRNINRMAVMASRCEIGDDFHIDGDTTVQGCVALPRATILGNVLLNDLAVENPGDRSIDFGGADIRGSLEARRSEPRGTVWLPGCHVHGSMAIDRSHFAEPDGPVVLVATGMTLGGDLRMSRVRTASGTLRFRAADIGGEITGQDSVLNNPGGETLSLSNAQVKGAVRLNGLTSTGLLVINRATIGGRLQLTDAELVCGERWEKNVHGRAVEMVSSQVGGGVYLDWVKAEPSVGFFSSTTTIVADEAATWPAVSDLSGFVYERFDTPDSGDGDPWDVEDRLAVLRSQQPFDLAPYEVAARVYSEHGRFAAADRIRMAGRRRASSYAFNKARRKRSLLRRAWAVATLISDWLYDHSVGFGYKPTRALGLVVALTVMVGVSLAGPWSGGEGVMRASGGSQAIYSPSGPIKIPVETASVTDEVCGADVRCFQPAVYAIETVVPLIELGQRGTWHVDSTARLGWLYELWLTFAAIAGWILSTVFVLSFSRLGRTT